MITVRNLSQLRSLKTEITAEREMLAKLAQTCYGSPGGPAVQNGTTGDPTARLACEIAYLKQLIADNMKRCICELLRMQKFINGIEDSELRIIFKERYIRGKTWTQIAFLLGGYDEQVPRRRHDRYLQAYNAKAERAENAPQQKNGESTFCTATQ